MKYFDRNRDKTIEEISATAEPSATASDRVYEGQPPMLFIRELPGVILIKPDSPDDGIEATLK